ncbi:wnt inhibitory factor 1-like isoform X2 [Octopus vulgaris]|uniref:Wnt inhibitory factor 1-like isoform X2 n=1 Tax=Octopus vulgaris TaxID=6645 RepID=A0AA36FKI0_OCTVU|nr:wnt inhibitory factor 1-like isoform X2 [Octopus vulgaris]
MYSYRFDDLTSLNLSLLYNPLLSITTSGEIPSRQSDFQVAIPCTGHKDGVAHLSLGLQVFDHTGKAIEGSPIKFRLRKHCKAHAMCYPKCENNGTCISPEKCACPEGYYGKHCEKALCKERCQNGGRCVKKGHCWCAPDFYGEACQYQHCNKSPCKNGGTCVGNNVCRCPPKFSGTICEVAKDDVDRTRRSHVNGHKRKRKKRPNKRRKRRRRMRAKKRNKKKRRKWKRIKRKKKKVRRKPV